MMALDGLREDVRDASGCRSDRALALAPHAPRTGASRFQSMKVFMVSRLNSTGSARSRDLVLERAWCRRASAKALNASPSLRSAS